MNDFVSSSALDSIGQSTPFLSEQKQQDLAVASQSNQAALGGNDVEALAVAIREGNDLSQNTLAQDLINLSPIEVELKYGSDVAAQQVNLRNQMDQIGRDQNAERSFGQKTGDAAAGVAAGAIQGLGGLAAIGAGVVNADAGAAVSEVVNDAAQGVRSLQSDELTRQKELGAIRGQLDAQDSAAQFAEDLETGALVPNLQRFGREFLTAGADLIDNPALAGDLAAEGVGSLAGSFGVGGLAARGTAKVALRSRGITGQAADDFLASNAGRQMISEIAEKGATPASIGLQEAGGAYAQIQQEIQGMSEAELSDSPEYLQMRESGLSHEEARNQIANDAGLEGGAIQGIIGLATGKLVSRFESNPLSAGTGNVAQRTAQAAQNVVREGAEEALQEASAGIISNVTIKDAVNDDRDVLEGAGTGAAQGLAGGVGVAGVLQGPGVVADASKATTEAAGQVAADVVQSRVNQVEESIEADSPTSTENLSTATDASARLVETITQKQDVTETESSENVAPPPVTQTTVEDLLGAVTISQAEVSETSEVITNLFPESQLPTPQNPEDVADYRINTVQNVARKISDGGLDEATTNEASLWLASQVNTIQRVADQAVEGSNEQLDAAVQAAAAEVDKIASNPTISRAIELAQKLTFEDFAPTPEVTEKNISSPEVQRAIQTQSLLAQTNPTGVNPEFIASVLNQKKIQFSDRVLKSLKVAGDIAREANAASAKKQRLAEETAAEIEARGLNETPLSPTEAVRRQIQYEGRNREKGQLGLAEHQSNIVSALARGNTLEAQASLDNLRSFGQSLVNKLEAARESYALGQRSDNKVTYEVFDGNSFIPGGGAVGISPFSPRSVQLGKDIAIDAESVVNTFNNLLETYSDELTGDPLSTGAKPNLDEDITLVDEADEAEPAVQTPTPEQEVAVEDAPSTEGVAEDVTEEPETTPELTEEEAAQEREEAEELADQAKQEEAGAEADRRAEEQAEQSEGLPKTGINKETVQPTFENLAKDANGVNRFVRAIKVDAEKSILMQGQTPINGVVNILEDFEDSAETLTEAGYGDAEKAKRFAGFVRKYAVPLAQAMDTRLDQKILSAKGKKISGADAVRQSDVDFTSFANGKNLAIVDPETGKYDPRLLGSAVLAALHWSLNQDAAKTPMKREDIAKIEGIQEHEVTPELVNAYNLYIHGNVAKESLAKTIMDFWGAETDASVTTSDTIGIAQGVAAELLVMMDGGLIKNEIVTTGEAIDAKGKTFEKKVDLIRINGDETIQKDLKELQGIASLLSDVFIPGAELTRYIGQAPVTTPGEKQKGNWLGQISSKYTEAVRRHRETPHYRNTQYIDLMKGLGRDLYVSLLGGAEFDPAVTHIAHAESLNGKLTGLRRSFDLTVAHDDQVISVAETSEQNPEDVATYYDYFVASNGRIMAKGFNGQSDKTMRESYSPTKSNLDLSDEGAHDRFWLAVGQMSGLVKTELEYRADAVAQAQEKIFKTYPSSIEALTEYARTGVVDDAVKDALRSELSGAEPHTLHALLAVGKYAVAVEDGRDSEAARNFETFLALEADGKTDGPFHAMMHFLAKPFSQKQIDGLRRGGFFPNTKDMTLNEMLREDTKDDLYEAAAEATKKVMDVIRGDIISGADPEVAKQFNAVRRLLVHLGGMEFDTDDLGRPVLKIGRGDLKNPLTITIYGSSEAGIASKIAAGVEESLYQRISEILTLREELGDPSIWFDQVMDLDGAQLSQFEADMKLLFEKRMYRAKGQYKVTPLLPQGVQAFRPGKKPIWTRFSLDRGMKSSDLKKFLLSPQNKTQLAETIKTSLVGAMTQAIDDVTDDARSTTIPMLAATAIQSEVVKTAFKKAVMTRVEEKRASGELGKQDQLSRADYKAIYKEVAPFAAVIESTSGTAHDGSHINLNAAERGDLGFEVARTMDGKIRGEAAIPGPSSAGVSAMPLATISEGDARMMVEYFANPANNPNAEQVFDGLNMPIEFIDEMSEAINEADAKAIFQNPLMNASDSFADFLRQGGEGGPLALIDDVASASVILKAIDRFVGAGSTLFADNLKDEDAVSLRELGREKEAKIRKIMSSYASVISDTMSQNAINAQARKDVMQGMGFSLDHMASGERPYNNDADLIDAVTDEQLIAEMNARYEARRAELNKARETEETAPEFAGPDERLATALFGLGDTEDGVKRLSMANLVSLMRSQTLDTNQTQIFEALQGSLGDFRVVYGSAEDLTTWRDRNYPPAAGEIRDPVDLGMTDLENRVIYIANAAHETVLHEMMHAAIGAIISDYYADNTLADNLSRTAILNLEKLMDQFMGLTFENEDPATLNAAVNLQSQINGYLALNAPMGRAAALNEFVAWSLTNQKIAKTLIKTKNRSILAPIVDKALRVIRKVLGLPNGTTLDVFSNIKANTAALIHQARLQPAQGSHAAFALHQRSSDPYLRDITRAFETKVKAHLDGLTVEQGKVEEEIDIEDVAQTVLNNLTANGVRLDPAQKSAFRAMQAAFASTMDIDRPSLVQSQKLFDAVIKTLTVEDLMEDQSGEWAPADRDQAEDLFNIVTGKLGTERDRHGRSTRLATFMALSQVSPAFRRMLETKSVPGKERTDTTNTDERLRSYGRQMMDRLSLRMAGDVAKSGTVRAALDSLTARIARVEVDARTHAEKRINGILTDGDHRGSNLLSRLGDKMVSFADGELRTREKGRLQEIEKIVRKTTGLAAAAVNEEQGKKVGRAAIALTNEASFVPDFMAKLLQEVIGITEDNFSIYQMINEVKTSISQLRQRYREDVPQILAENFSRDLEQSEWEAMFLGLGKTDIASLVADLGVAKVSGILQDPAKLKAERKKLEEAIKGVSSKVAPRWLQKADELATFMVTDEVITHNLLRNSEAVSRLLGERGTVNPDLAEKAQPLLDQLISLLALEKAQAHAPEAMTSVLELLEGEQAGVEFAMNYMTLVRAKELEKATTPAARLNSYKGYIPSEHRDGAKLRIEDDKDHTALVQMGYTRVGDYVSAGFEKGSKGYYFSNVGGNATFNQGIVQTVQKTAGGVDIQTGRSVTGMTGGLLARGSVKKIQAQLRSGSYRKNGEAVMPIYDDAGNVTAYERSMAPEQLAKLQSNRHLGKMLGAWAGRQAEEESAQVYNEVLVTRSHELWTSDKAKNRHKEYIDLSDPDHQNQVWRDAWGMIPPETKEFIEETFGDDGFMVRKDMIDNIAGYRSLSIGEAWDGASNLPEPVKKAIKDTTTFVLGKNAFKYSVTAEKAWQAGVSFAKQTIVIRSFIVPAANIASNVLQLMTNGVPVRNISKGFKVKLIEIDQHLKNEERRLQIEAELTQYGENSIRRRKLETEAKSLRDSSQRMSIWPLIEAGEFATISEGLTDADAAIAQGRWADMMQNALEKIPAKFGTVGRYAVVAQDTALFQGMSRAVQYGDFLAKSVLYDHLIATQPKEEVDLRVTNEFVNYNYLPGRARSYSESMGLAWFWAYKLRSVKVAHRMMRDNPLRALLTSIGMPFIPEPLGVSTGSPLDDNALSVIADGRAGYSLGTDMLWRSPSLNPWMNLAH